jgi:hypothetical protein
MRGPETRLRLKIKKRLEELWPAAWIRKIHGSKFMHVGIPDYICCIDGEFFGLEVKIPGGKATPSQLLEGKKIVLAKGHFAVVTSVEEATEFVRKTLKEKRL